MRPSRFLRPTFVEGNSPPRLDAPIAARRIFVDRPHVEVATSTNRAGYLSGGEFVGRPVQATDPDDADLSYFVGLEDPDYDFWFFDVSPSGQLHVSPAGGNDRLGLTDDRVYRARCDCSRPKRRVGCGHGRGLSGFSKRRAARRRRVSELGGFP